MPAPPSEKPSALEAIGRALDAVDVHTEALEALHDALSAGFFALSREQASSHAASLQLSASLYDARAGVTASLRVAADDAGRLALLDTRRETVGADERGGPGAGGRAADGTGLRQRKGGKPAPGADAAAARRVEEQRAIAERKAALTAPRHSLHAMPSAALREAAESFERAVAAAIAVANAAVEVDARLEEVPAS